MPIAPRNSPTRDRAQLPPARTAPQLLVFPPARRAGMAPAAPPVTSAFATTEERVIHTVVVVLPITQRNAASGDRRSSHALGGTRTDRLSSIRGAVHRAVGRGDGGDVHLWLVVSQNRAPGWTASEILLLVDQCSECRHQSRSNHRPVRRRVVKDCVRPRRPSLALPTQREATGVQAVYTAGLVTITTIPPAANRTRGDPRTERRCTAFSTVSQGEGSQHPVHPATTTLSSTKPPARP